MTKREREQVVELLRCAADEYVRGNNAPLTTAASDLDVAEHVARHADAAACTVIADSAGTVHSNPWLEAAACVEEGSWP